MSTFFVADCPQCRGAGTIRYLSISEVMSACRASRDLSLRSVEAQSGISASTISRIENGNAADWATMVALAKFYELSLDKLATLPIARAEALPEAEPEP